MMIKSKESETRYMTHAEIFKELVGKVVFRIAEYGHFNYYSSWQKSDHIVSGSSHYNSRRIIKNWTYCNLEDLGTSHEEWKELKKEQMLDNVITSDEEYYECKGCGIILIGNDTNQVTYCRHLANGTFGLCPECKTENQIDNY